MLTYVRAFIAGFVSTLVFHQGVWQLLYLCGAVPHAAWDMTQVPPLSVPSVLSLAFWGGLWGIAIWLLVRRQAGVKQWLMATLWGAVLPSLVALLLVFPLKGMPVAGGFDPKIIVGALILNGAWGFGVALFMRVFTPRQGNSE